MFYVSRLLEDGRYRVEDMYKKEKSFTASSEEIKIMVENGTSFYGVTKNGSVKIFNDLDALIQHYNTKSALLGKKLFEFSVDDERGIVCKRPPQEQIVEIPEIVSVIGECCFQENDILEEVILNEGLAEIEPCAFYRCKFLTKINFPDSLTKIGYDAFSYSGFRRIHIKKDVEYGTECFKCCSYLKTVTFDEEIETLPAGMFSGCLRLEDITLPSSLISIPIRAFEGTGLKKIKLGGNIKFIRTKAFESCLYLTTVILKESVKNIGNFAFSTCKALRNVQIYNPDCTLGIGSFYCCESLINIGLPENIKEIPYGCFKNCSSLARIDLKGVETVGTFAFEYCSSLENIGDTTSITSIGGRAFFDCKVGNCCKITLRHDCTVELGAFSHDPLIDFI